MIRRGILGKIVYKVGKRIRESENEVDGAYNTEGSSAKEKLVWSLQTPSRRRV